MLANLARVAARPSAGLIRRAATSTTTIAAAVPKHLRCASTLSQVLRAEIEEERLVALDEDVMEMVKGLKKKGITIKDERGVSLVRLFGPGVGDEKVTVEFNCDVEGDEDDGWEDDLEDESDQEGAQEAQQVGDEKDGEEDDDDNMIGPGYRFTATITKGAKKMTVTGTASSHISLAGVRVNPVNVEWDSSLYRGPVFHELDPDLQDAMLDYLKKRNIDDELAAFICMYADQKEQTEYTNWLEEVEKFAR